MLRVGGVNGQDAIIVMRLASNCLPGHKWLLAWYFIWQEICKGFVLPGCSQWNPWKTTFPCICGTSYSRIPCQNRRALINRSPCSADLNARKGTSSDSSAKWWFERDCERLSHIKKLGSWWHTVANYARRVFMLFNAVKTNHVSLYHKFMADMAPLFFPQGEGGGGAKLCTIPEMVWNFPHQHWSESSWCISVAELLNSVVRSMKPGCAAGSKLTQQWKNLSWNLQNLGAVSYTVYKRESMIKKFMSKHGNFMNNLTCMQATKNGNKNVLFLKILKMSCCYSLSCWCRRHWTPSELLSISKALLVWMSKISQSNSRNVWTVQWITNHSSWVIKYSHAK